MEQGTSTTPSPVRAVAVFVGEHVLLALALLLTIPPMTSHEDHPYRLDVGLLVVIFAAVFASRWIARCRRETWLGALVKASMLAAFGFGNYLAR